jgi:positive regulator of sigma E activity
MKEIGVIISKNGNISTVEMKSSPACVKCGACVFKNNSTVSIEAVDDTRSKAGDTVEVEIPEKTVILSSLMIFIFPLVAFFAGYIILGILAAFEFLFLYLAFLFWYDRHNSSTARILRVLS